jgi:hypothetical protein
MLAPTLHAQLGRCWLLLEVTFDKTRQLGRFRTGHLWTRSLIPELDPNCTAGLTSTQDLLYRWQVVGMGVTTRYLHRTAAITASGTTVLTLVVCLAIAKSNNVYTGGLAWPYFSDLGRGTCCCMNIDPAVNLTFVDCSQLPYRLTGLLRLLRRPHHCSDRSVRYLGL